MFFTRNHCTYREFRPIDDPSRVLESLLGPVPRLLQQRQRELRAKAVRVSLVVGHEQGERGEELLLVDGELPLTENKEERNY